MMYDTIPAWRGTKEEKRFLWPLVIAAVLVFVLSGAMFLNEYQYQMTDLYIHANIAADFDFTDLHSITSRLSYPLWHIAVSILYQLGMPLHWASTLICALCKTLVFLLSYQLVRAIAGKDGSKWLSLFVTLLLMVVTGIWIPSVSHAVYRGVGSPNVWHNPTQQIVTAAMMMVMPFLAHCWYEFEKQLDEGKQNITIAWWKVLVLAVLLMGSLACKPTFMQALLPAAFVMYLVEVFRHPKQWRYFGQIILAFLPSVGYFLLSYLYYTGVVVEFTSGVEFGITAEYAWKAIRNTLMMGAAPLLCVLACWKKGMFKDRQIVLALLMVVFSTLEAMAFRETGQREGHGNFTWAANSSAFYLWVVMAGVFLREFAISANRRAKPVFQKLLGAGVVLLFVYHVYSGIYYLYYLLTTGNAF